MKISSAGNNHQVSTFGGSQPQVEGSGLVRVLVVERDRILRDALAAVLSKFGTIQVVHCAGIADAYALHQDIEQHGVDIVVFRKYSQEDTANACVRTLKRLRHEALIIITGLADDDGEILAAIEAGASGIATVATSVAELVDNIHAVADGKTICSPRISGLLFSRFADRSARGEPEVEPKIARLTRRERQVIGLVEQGLTNKEIATRLRIEVQTVKNHVHNILEKLDLKRRMEVARFARTIGWVDTGTSTRSSPTFNF